MTFALRLLALLAALLFLRWLWGRFWRSGWKRLLTHTLERTESRAAPPAHHGTFKRDPVCGTYVDVELSVQASETGQTLYFCSERCRDAYRDRQRVRAEKIG